jgi:hypothetical protein
MSPPVRRALTIVPKRLTAPPVSLPADAFLYPTSSVARPLGLIDNRPQR